MSNKNKIWIVDMILVVVSLAVFAGAGYYVYSGEGLQLSPDESGVRTSALFSFSGVNDILVDDNFEFGSPEKYLVFDGRVVRINRGLNYMKLNYGSYSEVRKFELDSSMDFVLRKNADGSYSVLISDGAYAVNVYDGGGKFRNNVLLEGQNE